MRDAGEQRHKTWHFYRRVPAEYARLDPRRFVRISTKIRVARDRTGTKASRAAAKINETLEAHWRSLANGSVGISDAKQVYADAIKLARSVGLDYLPPAEAAQRPLDEVLARVDPARSPGTVDARSPQCARRRGRQERRLQVAPGPMGRHHDAARPALC